MSIVCCCFFNLIFALFLFLFISHYLKKSVHGPGPWQGVHGPGPWKWSMDPVQSGGPWTPGPCFVLTLFATVAVFSNGRQKDNTKEHVQRESPLTSCVLFPCRLLGPRARPPFSFVKYVLDCVHVVSFLACVAGVRNFKNLLLINQKIYAHGWVFVCYQYWGMLYCNVLPAFSLRDASWNVIYIEITCRTFGSVIAAFFPLCSFARGKGSLETMSYLTVFNCRQGFRSTLKWS